MRHTVSLFLSLTVIFIGSQADAWVQDFYGDQLPFSDGEAAVVVHRFCRSGSACTTEAATVWEDAIRYAVSQWNAAGSSFRFRTRAMRSNDNPCSTADDAVVIIALEQEFRCGYPAPDDVVPVPVNPPGPALRHSTGHIHRVSTSSRGWTPPTSDVWCCMSWAM